MTINTLVGVARSLRHLHVLYPLPMWAGTIGQFVSKIQPCYQNKFSKVNIHISIDTNWYLLNLMYFLLKLK